MKFTLGIALLGALQVASANPVLIGTAKLTGDQEAVPTGSTATGFLTLSLDGDTLEVILNFTGLLGGPADAAHIHCCAPPGTSAPVALPFIDFPTATSGTYSKSFDLTSASVYTSSFFASSGGEAALLAAIQGGLAYTNIHDAAFPGGEIRGNIIPPVPEPSSLGMIALILSGALGGIRLRRLRRF